MVFRINTDGTSYTPIHAFTDAEDGAFPQYAGLLVGTDGMLYGTTTLGGNFWVGGDIKTEYRRERRNGYS